MTAHAYIHPSAFTYGRVSIGRGSSVWPGAVLRADLAAIRVGAYTNIQDNAVVHCDMDHASAIGSFATTGHGAVIHGSVIGDCCIIGMNSVVLNGSSIGRGSIVAAGSVVRRNTIAPPYSLIAGNPAVIKENRYDNIRTHLESALIYACLSVLHREGIVISDSLVKSINAYALEEASRLNDILFPPDAPAGDDITIRDFPFAIA